jgi:hypothetical protein
MGGGSSIDHEKQFDTPLKTPEIQDNLWRSTEHVQERISPQPQQETQLKWPLPKKEQEKDFVPNQSIDNQRYSLLKSQYERVSQYFRSMVSLFIRAKMLIII